MKNDKALHRIVVAGGGFGGTVAFRLLYHHFRHRTDVSLVLVNRENYFLFTPLLHEVATGSISPINIVEPLRPALGDHITQFYCAEIERIDLSQRIVQTSLGAIAYDTLLVAVGAQTAYYGIEGAREHSFPLKTVQDALNLKRHIIDVFERASKEENSGRRKKLLRFVIVGGGATGVEVAGELSEFVRGTFHRFYPEHATNGTTEIIQLQRADELLLPFTPASRIATLEALRRKGVEVRFHESASKLEQGIVHLASGGTIEAETVIWVAGVEASSLPMEGADRDASGRIPVNGFLQLRNVPNVFAIGDIAAVSGSDGKPLPQLAQVASKQAIVAADNIARFMQGKPLHLFQYRSSGNLVSVGRGMAIAELPGITLRGWFAWWLWRTIYLTKLLSWSKRIEVGLDWFIDLFRARDISKL